MDIQKARHIEIIFIIGNVTHKIAQPRFVNVEVWNICLDVFLDLKVPIRKLAKNFTQKKNENSKQKIMIMTGI